MEELVKAVQELGNPSHIDRIQMCLTILSIGISVVALIFAIRIPKIIAAEQNKIAIFENRLKCYTAINNLIACASQIETAANNKAVQAAFKFWIGKADRFTVDEYFGNMLFPLKEMERIVVSGAFLFPNYNEKLIKDAVNEAIDLITAVASHDRAEAEITLSSNAIKHKLNFCKLCNEFDRDYLESLESELQLVKMNK